jgi:hypothetical protein
MGSGSPTLRGARRFSGPGCRSMATPCGLNVSDPRGFRLALPAEEWTFHQVARRDPALIAAKCSRSVRRFSMFVAPGTARVAVCFRSCSIYGTTHSRPSFPPVIFSFEAGSRTKGEKGSVAASKRFYLVATKATDQDYISSTSLGRRDRSHFAGRDLAPRTL